MKKLLTYSKPYLSFVIVSLIIKAIGSMADLLIPYLLGKIIDDVAPQCSPDNLTPIFIWGGGMFLCAVVAILGNICANQRACFFAKEVIQNLRKDTFDKILSLSASQTDSFTIPSLVSRMSSDTYAVHSMLGMLLRIGIRAPFLLIGGMIITLFVEPVLSLTLILILPLMAFIVMNISKKGVRLYKEKQKKVDAMVEKVRDTFTGIRVIKALSKVNHERESFAAISDDLSQSEKTASFTMGVSRPIVNIFLNLGMTGVIALGAIRVTGGHSSPGQIISFMSYFSMFLNATLAITRIFTMTSRGMASADRISEVLDTPAELLLQENLPAEENAPFLEFRNVSFSYHKTNPTVSGISFTLKKGQTLGIIGATGSGKTTLIQLLLRFYDPDEGQILLEGKDIRSIPKKELRRQFGIVFQNDFLIADTIKENIFFGRDLEESSLEQAADSAQALSFISNLEEKFDHRLTAKGSNLSGGQKQRILISRALAGNPEILVLDDSSSALDYKTDAALRQKIEEKFHETTRIIVTQRISSIRNADLILVLEKGRVIGMGTDQYLAKSCEIYGEIAQSQMGELAI